MQAIDLPLPPRERSIEGHVQQEWGRILASWRKGWAAESNLADLEHFIEFEQARIFERGEFTADFNWQLDWLRAKAVHDSNVDFVRNRRAHADDVKKMWIEWCDTNTKSMSELSLEALKSMVILDGAAILAALAVLSGQISTPTHAAQIASKCTILFSVVSLIMMAAGHSILFLRIGDLLVRVRSTLLGNANHAKLYAIGRYLQRHLNPLIDVANGLIFGSIIVFAMGSFIAAMVLVFA